jgi:S1-C subfamily serine protease
MVLGAIAGLLAAALLGQRIAAPDPAPSTSRVPTNPRPPVAQAPFETTITVDAPSVLSPGAGTAFSISSGGMWLTARHVVEGCAHTAIVVAPGQGVAAEVRIDPRAETAVLITQGGAPALPLAPREALEKGMSAFHAGFPGGRPGQIASRLMQRETLVLRGHRVRREQVLAWAETPEDGPLPRSLAGLSGAPALDPQGRVIGVTIAQSRRRAQVYTTTPASLRAALARAHIQTATGAQAAPMTTGSFSRISDTLRRELRIVPVVCLPG